MSASSIAPSAPARCARRRRARRRRAPIAALAQELPLTPQCHDGDKPTAPADRRAVLQAEVAATRRSGRARRQGRAWSSSPASCSRAPAGRSPRALVDLWHADECGEYDNSGFRYRGHVFTDAQGRYRFRTIVPAIYSGRTRHYHVKVQAPRGRVLTTQLYFPATRRQPPRLPVPAGTADAGGRSRGRRLRGAVRFRPRPALEGCGDPWRSADATGAAASAPAAEPQPQKAFPGILGPVPPRCARAGLAARRTPARSKRSCA